MLDVISVLAGIAWGLLAMSQRIPILIAFALIAIALICAALTAVMTFSEQHRRSLRRKRSTYVWSALAYILVMAANVLAPYVRDRSFQG